LTDPIIEARDPKEITDFEAFVVLTITLGLSQRTIGSVYYA
jgi:hypothetical protein